MNKIENATVYVIGQDCIVRDEINWREAVTNIINGKMSPFLVHPTKRVRSGGLTKKVDMAFPIIVQMNYWVKPVFRDETRVSRVSRKLIMQRDGFTCAYCGSKANTVDHIKPESRCKKDNDTHNGWTWGNLVAACQPCNQKKADKTPEEAGMRLLWSPKVGTKKFSEVQKHVLKMLQLGEEYYQKDNKMLGILTHLG